MQVRCWQIREHTKAPQAAGAIHSDFERGFICAEIMAFEDMKEHGSEAGECGSVRCNAVNCRCRGVQRVQHWCRQLGWVGVEGWPAGLAGVLGPCMRVLQPPSPLLLLLCCARAHSLDPTVPSSPAAAVKAAGKWRQEGKTYEVQDGDIVHWKFNVTASAKK